MQYFKSIETVSLQESARLDPQETRVAEEPKTKNWRGALKELTVDTQRKRILDDDEELTPDSMSSRMVDSGVAGLDQKDGHFDLIIDRLGSRVGAVGA